MFAAPEVQSARPARPCAMPDPALAAMGLTRETMARWLFRDIFND